MKHTYTITGMTCNGCKASVEKAIQLLPEVENVDVNLEMSEATIFMSKHISTETLQSALSSKYSILEKRKECFSINISS